MAFSSKKNNCKEMEDLNGLSAEQLSSQYFALVKSMNNRDKELAKVQRGVQELDYRVKEGVKSLQEITHQEARLKQKKELLNEQLETVLNENTALDDRVQQIKACNENKQATLENRLNELQSSLSAPENEKSNLQATVEHETEQQINYQKYINEVVKKTEEMRSKNQKIEGPIGKIENKLQKTNERSYRLQKANSAIDQGLKSSIDSYNGRKNELISLEKTLLEMQRSLGQTKTAYSKNRDAEEEKERQLQAARASKFSTISDLFLLNDSIRSLRSANKKTAAQIEQIRKDIVHWNDKNGRNTDALADTLNRRNTCGSCGAQVSMQ